MNVLITGATKGIGKAIAIQYAQHGHTLLLCSRNSSNLLAAQLELTALHPSTVVHTYTADVSSTQACNELATWCLATVPYIHVLVNNAGVYLPGSIHSEPAGQLELMMATNLYSAYTITRAILPSMIARQQGHIINIASIASTQAYPNGGSYSISKYALLGLSNNLREELKPHHIKVTAVLPGAVYTHSWSGSGVDPERIMHANDVAIMVYASTQLSTQAVVENMVLRPQLGDL